MKKAVISIYEFDELSSRAQETAVVEINMLFGSKYFKTDKDRDDYLRTREFRKDGRQFQTDATIDEVRAENEKHGN